MRNRPPVDRIARGDNAARLVWPFLGVPAAAVAVHLAFAWSGHEAQSPLALWSPWAFIEIVVGAVGPLVWLRCLVLRTHRLAWALVGLAAELTLGGFISYDVQVGPGQPISSSGLFEYFWFGSLPIAAYAVWRLSVPLVSRVRLANGFDAVAAGALAMAALALFLGRQVLSWDSTDA